MTRTGPANAGHYDYDGDDSQARDAAFAAAWSAFASDDARATVPFALAARVREAAQAACALRHANRRIARRQRILVALGTAAALALAIAGLLSRKGPAETPDARIRVSTEIAVEHQPRRDALVTLAVDPVQETEQLALVHIRVTQDALLPLGIATNEPGASGLIDVEVLVGGDGLPRDIRSMRTVLTSDERDSRD